MSFFGGNTQSQQTINPQNMMMAEQELEMVTDLFNRITESCYSKCIMTKYEQGELNQPEGACIDTCVAKFFQVNSMVGEKMQKIGQA
ncbi:hypothetical protein CLU79DRAFT_754470 [Phycomyces nitens]|nr:hypothetical protein CLU79DRAFT_754470 [Phycomyces nitens]